MAEVDPSAASSVMRMLTGAWVAQAIHVAAKLGIADLLRAGPKAVNELAAASGAHAPSLYRVLRALASLGIFREDADRSFGLTPMAECLRSDVAHSLRGYAVMVGEEGHWRSWGAMLHSVRTGQPAFDHVFGMPIFPYYSQHPEAARISVEGLASLGAMQNAAIVDAYDFAHAGTIVDVGGGRGTLLGAIIKAWPTAKGLLFDLPHVIEAVRATPGTPYACATGDFFESVPNGGDIYILKRVLSDWTDDRAGTILKNCRAAMTSGKRLLVIDQVVPTGNEPSYAKLLDLLMLVYAGGRARTEIEYRDLLRSAGLHLKRIIPTRSTISIVEATPT